MDECECASVIHTIRRAGKNFDSTLWLYDCVCVHRTMYCQTTYSQMKLTQNTITSLRALRFCIFFRFSALIKLNKTGMKKSQESQRRKFNSETKFVHDTSGLWEACVGVSLVAQWMCFVSLFVSITIIHGHCTWPYMKWTNTILLQIMDWELGGVGFVHYSLYRACCRVWCATHNTLWRRQYSRCASYASSSLLFSYFNFVNDTHSIFVFCLFYIFHRRNSLFSKWEIGRI